MFTAGMKVLVGECTGRLIPELQELGWGRMWIARDRNIYTYDGEPWGFDNGAYRDWKAGQVFSEGAYLDSLDKALVQGSQPYLAVLPDVPTAGKASLELSLHWLERVGCNGFPWYMAVQNGMEPSDVEPHVSELAGCFLGGDDAYKATAGIWCDWAHRRGLLFHYGRCGTQPKLAHAQKIGADSIDSALPQMYPAIWRVFRDAVLNGTPQKDLFW